MCLLGTMYTGGHLVNDPRVCMHAHCLQHPSSTLEIANLCDQAEGVAFVLQVFGLLDMHEQLDGHMSVLSEVLSNTNSGSLLRVSHQCSSDYAASKWLF